METHRFSPRWRGGATVEVIERPGEPWFANRTTLRFALMQDGTIYFADAEHVLHRDMVELTGVQGDCPLLVGALWRTPGAWRLYWWSFHGVKAPRDVARRLLAHFEDWSVAVWNMGGDDPFAHETLVAHADD